MKFWKGKGSRMTTNTTPSKTEPERTAVLAQIKPDAPANPQSSVQHDASLGVEASADLTRCTDFGLTRVRPTNPPASPRSALPPHPSKLVNFQSAVTVLITIKTLAPRSVCEKFDRRKSWLWDTLKSDPSFPRPRYLSPGAPVFLESELDEWLLSRPRVSNLKRTRRQINAKPPRKAKGQRGKKSGAK